MSSDPERDEFTVLFEALRDARGRGESFFEAWRTAVPEALGAAPTKFSRELLEGALTETIGAWENAYTRTGTAPRWTAALVTELDSFIATAEIGV